MKIILPGGTGQVGQVLVREFLKQGHDVVVLSRGGRSAARTMHWDGRTLGPWAAELEGADVVFNLAGRSVNCRYNKHNLTEMLCSRTDSTRVVGEAIAQAVQPPRLWLQMSTATVYAHRFDAPNDEATGIIGGDEPDAPGYWRYSIEIARAWERAQQDAATPHTRKVALRAAMVMSPTKGGIFDMLLRMTRLGFGGPIAGGRQYMSWIHELDFMRAIDLLIARDNLEGVFNLAAPAPLPQRDFMRAIRQAAGMPIGLPAAAWMIEVGAVFLRTDSELVLKSRRVVPGRLVGEGFQFEYPEWPEAARELVHRGRASGSD